MHRRYIGNRLLEQKREKLILHGIVEVISVTILNITVSKVLSLLRDISIRIKYSYSNDFHYIEYTIRKRDDG